jgi:hypothetical protein
MMNHFIEIGSLHLKPGTREEQGTYPPALPKWEGSWLRDRNFDMVAHGPSLGDENTYYVIRRHDSLALR